MRLALIEHLGGKASVTQIAMIEQAAQLKLRLALFDLKFRERPDLTELDSRTYLAWSNSFVRLLRELGLKPPEERAPPWQEIVAGLPARQSPQNEPSAPLRLQKAR